MRLITVVFLTVILSSVRSKKTFDLSKDVEIDSGPVRGYLAEDGDYYAFLGINYAIAPIGRRRFKAPFPLPYWENLFIANRTVRCPQLGKGDEDCLIVNVFTPISILNGPLPVLFYIHGGSFLLGSGQTKGAGPLVKQNVIVVTVNYRLGALGFLCLGVDEAPGNAGLKDQVAALKWVQKNIAAFGGDPNNVSIYGMSAGGASAELLLLSPLSDGLFHKAIIESGTGTAVWSVDSDPVKTAWNFFESLNMTSRRKNVYKVLDTMRMLPAKELSVINNEFYENLTDGTFGFVACVERKLYGTASFLSEPPLNLIKKGAYKRVPIMFIFASLEGLFLRSSDYSNMNYKERMNENFEDFLPADLIFDTDQIKSEVAENVRQFYFGNKTIGDNTLVQYLNYFGDSLILHGLLNSVKSYSKTNIVYLLEFGYKGNLGSREKLFDHLNEAGHGDAIKHVILNKPIKNNDDRLIVDRMVKIVANFMTYSNPIPHRTDLLPFYWPPVTPDNVTYLYMNKELQVYEEPFWERKRFWDSLYSTFRREVATVDPGFCYD